MSPPPTYFPLRWESTGDQWWYASPIDWAAANGHYDLVRELLRIDGNHLIKLTSLRRIRRLETVWDDDRHFHHVAASRSHVARSLLAECDLTKGPNSLVGSGYGGWLLYTAASAGDLPFVRDLLQRDPLLVFGEGEYGVTDILYAAARSKDSEVFRVILDFASCPRFSTGDHHQAAAGEIPSGYKLEIMNRALHAAARGGNLGLLKELIGACSDDQLAYRDMRGATILHAAAARGQVEVVKYLMTSSSSSSDIINSTDKQGNTALHVAAHRGHLPVVEAIILSSPCSIYTTNNAGETFIHSVVSGFQSPGFRRLDRQIDLLKHLLCKSTNLFDLTKVVNLTNNDGKTALHLAITGNVHSDLVELLMTIRGIDVNIRDKSGMTPLDILRRRPHSASSELLTRQLISAGGIFSSQDYSARRVIASHIRRHSTGNSPGTSFRISDVEIFLYTGMENNASSVGLSNYSPEKVSQHDSNEESKYRASPRKHVNSTAQRLKRFFHWPKMKKERPTSEIVPPVSLRQRFSKPSPVVNSNKRALSVRSNVPSPGGKKKVASGMMDGVMQSFAVGDRKSRSSSFSKFSFSSQSSLDGQRAAQIENEVAKAASCSMQRPHGMGSRRLMNSYLCFGGPAIDSRQPFDVYERSVLSGA